MTKKGQFVNQLLYIWSLYLKDGEEASDCCL